MDDIIGIWMSCEEIKLGKTAILNRIECSRQDWLENIFAKIGTAIIKILTNYFKTIKKLPLNA